MTRIVLALALSLTTACTFAPDYSRYEQCVDGACPSGYRCYAEGNLCLSDCGPQPCPADAGEDAGETDAGRPPKDGGVILFETTLAPAIEGEPYSHRFGADGGTPPYVFTAEPVPPGFTFDAGLLEGIAGDAGSSLFAVEVIDSTQDKDQAQVALATVKRLRIASGGPDDGGLSELSDADSNEAYSEQLSATGQSNLSWAIDGGSLPSGLTLSTTGQISGTTSSSSSFTVVAISAGPPEQVRARQLRIDTVSLGLGLHVRTRTLPLGRVGEPYRYKLSSGGGTGTHSWEVIGTVPGLSLNANNELEGTPTLPGDYPVTLKVTDTTLGTAQRSFTLRIDP